MTSLRWLTFLLRFLTVTLTVSALLDLFLSSDASICSTMVPWLSLHWEVLIMLSSQFPLTFHQTQNKIPHSTSVLMTILVLIGIIFVIIWDMFHGKISLNSVLLLLLVNFVSGFTLELMYISLIISIRSSLDYLHRLLLPMP